MLSVALLLARPDEGKLQQNQVQIDNSQARAATSCHKTENGSVYLIFMKK